MVIVSFFTRNNLEFDLYGWEMGVQYVCIWYEDHGKCFCHWVEPPTLPNLSARDFSTPRFSLFEPSFTFAWHLSPKTYLHNPSTLKQIKVENIIIAKLRHLRKLSQIFKNEIV